MIRDTSLRRVSMWAVVTYVPDWNWNTGQSRKDQGGFMRFRWRMGHRESLLFLVRTILVV